MSLLSNYEAALRAEQKRAIRGYQSFTSEQRANLRSSHRAGFRQREATGEAFWTHPDIPGRCFPTRIAAARAALAASTRRDGPDMREVG